MGGFTTLKLKDTSKENIDKHNQMLKDAKVRKALRFYSEDDVRFEYQAFINFEGAFPNDQFPREKIKSYEDFTKYWNTEALGECFCPEFGTLIFDCYYGRTSKNAMKCLKDYIINALLLVENTGKTPFECANGSWSTFLERCGASKLDLELINEKIIDK